jgi:hypothetical protein
LYKNSYPADPTQNSNLTSLIKLLSLAIIGVESYIGYFLITHLYEYVTTVNREPDLVMIISVAVLFLVGLKISGAAYGLHFVTKHTERTPENYDGLFKFLNLSTFIHLIITMVLYYGINYHVEAYNEKF